MKVESLAEFLNRGGKIKTVATQASQGIKINALTSDKVISEDLDLDEDSVVDNGSVDVLMRQPLSKRASVYRHYFHSPIARKVYRL